MGSAKASYGDGVLTVSTGLLSRQWQVTPNGLATRRIVDEDAGREWTAAPDRAACDWRLPGVDEGETVSCRVESVRMAEDDDGGFTSPHLSVMVELVYPGPAARLRYVIRAWPDVPGLRTRLWLSPGVSADVLRLGATGPAERLPIALADAEWHAAGYYNHTQARNRPETDLLQRWRQEGPHAGGETIDWASLGWAVRDGAAVGLVKESHKCPNQPGCDTGAFAFDLDAGLTSTGWGLAGGALDPRAFHPAWAHWTVCAAGADVDYAFQRAVKTVDRTRFDFDPGRDVYIISNTWGSGGNQPRGRGSRDAAAEANVLAEIDAAADLGIDVVQIDDGWQLPAGRLKNWHPPADLGWRPHPDMYPEGWANVRRRATEAGVKLGLWAAAQWIAPGEMLDNWRDGGFVQWKLDFAVLRRPEEVHELVNKVRRFIQATGHRVRMNFDATEVAPRFGYYFGREFGCCYLENRKPYFPDEVVYIPHLVLRDLWQVAHFADLHRFQGSVQNVRMVNPDRSDAHLHPQTYAVAVALAATPVFFMELQNYDAADRDAIRPLLAAYRARRDDMYRGLVHPVGEQPDNASWSGFQVHRADDRAGELLLFRERLNEQATRGIALRELAGETIELVDHLTGDTSRQTLTDAGEATFEIHDAPGFRFLGYRAAK